MLLLWRDGGLTENAEQSFDLTDRGLMLGDGVFDTALVVNGRIHRRSYHQSRLLAALRALSIPIAPERIAQAYDILAEAAASRKISLASLRLTITRGPGPRGLGWPATLQPSFIATLAPLAGTVAFTPLTLQVSTISRNETSPASRIKALSALDAVMAHHEATMAGCDEALQLDTTGNVACAATGNLFLIVNGRIVTPATTQAILPGTIRDLLLGGVSRHGHAIAESIVPWADVEKAEAIFMTNSLRLLAPVSRIGNRVFASATHEIILSLQDFLRGDIERECGEPVTTSGCGL